MNAECRMKKIKGESSGEGRAEMGDGSTLQKGKLKFKSEGRARSG
jgi:hypothetical protein